MGIVGPAALHRSLASHRPKSSGPQSSVLQGDAWVVVSTQWVLKEEPLLDASGAHSQCALSGLLFPLQWLDCSPVYTEARLGCVNHHDGGGWLLHPLCCALTLPLEAGKWWVLGQQ